MAEPRVHYGVNAAHSACGNANAQEFVLDREKVTCKTCCQSSMFEADFFNNVPQSLAELDELVARIAPKQSRRNH